MTSSKMPEESSLLTLENVLQSDKSRLVELAYITNILHQVATLINTLHLNDLCLGRLEPSSIIISYREVDSLFLRNKQRRLKRQS